MKHLNHHRSSLWLLAAIASLVLAACGGGGGSASSTHNPTVAAQVQTLKPNSTEDSVGVFVELDTTKLSAAAQSDGEALAQQRALQEAFLAQLAQAAKNPVAAGASTTSCDVAQLTQRIKDAYLPASGAAVRLELSACELDLLPGMPLVSGVYPDMPLSPQNSATTVSSINTAVKYSFDGTTAWPKYSDIAADGTGVVVAVIDTGVELQHPAFAGKLEKGACFSTPTTGGQAFCPNSTTVDTTSANAGESCINSFGNRSAANSAGCGHGTSMAGVAAMNYTNASNTSIKASGVANNARILPIQVFTGGISSGKASIYANSGDLLRSIEWLTTEAQRRNTNNLPRIAAVNMSLGGGSYTSACDTDYTGNLFKTAFANLRAQGVLPVVAAGNEGYDSAVSFPACIGNVVAVGATKLGSSAIASYSNISPQVKVFAQGGDRGASFSIPTTSNNAASLDAWAAAAGTSPATAMVSGAVAVLRQLKPAATLADIEAALQTSDKATIIDRTGTSRSIPQLRVTAAANKLTGQSAETPAPAPAPAPAPVPAPVPAPSPLAVAPTLVLSSSPTGQVNTNVAYEVKLTAQDTNNNLQSLTLRWEDQPEESKDISGSSQAVTFARTFTQAGVYTWFAHAVDATGLQSGTYIGQVTVSGASTEQVPSPTPAPAPATVSMRLCVYSQINYAGQRSCGIFEQGESVTFSGRWTIRSVKYLAFDPANSSDVSKDLTTATKPSVSFYNTPMAMRRGPAAGVTVKESTPNLSQAMPNSWVSTIGFTWSN